MLDLRKGLIRTLKKHQKLTVSLLSILLLVLGDIVYEYGRQDLLIIKKDNEAIKMHEQRLSRVEGNAESNRQELKNIVTRQSFNSYIARKDDEYHRQQYFNEQITKSISELSGKMCILEEFINIEMEKNDHGN